MKTNLFYIGIAAIALFAGCKTKQTAITHNTTDSIRVEIRERTVMTKDTVRIAIPTQSAMRETHDSISRLENEWAVSTAAITPNGTLRHTLDTKPRTLDIPTEHPTVYRDSIIYRDRYINSTRIITKEVAKPLTRWQQLKADVGGITIVISALGILCTAIWLVWRFKG